MQAVDSNPVSVNLFGGPRLLRNGSPIPLSRHQACVLALAYGNGEQGMSRAEAGWLLWESDDSPAIRHRISQLLYALRRRTRLRCIDEPSSTVLRGALPSDVAALSRSLEEHRLAEVRPVAGKTFLSELNPPTAAFAHWMDARRASLRAHFREVAAAELAAAEAAADWQRVAAAAGVLLELDPGDEKMLRRMLEACALFRSRDEIEATLRSYGERQRIHTGERWSPEGATLDLLGRIEELERRQTPDGATPVPHLVGRTEELRRLHEALSVQPTSVRFTVVAGEAGIGKTRLVREALTRTRLAGCTVLESGSSPLQRDLPLHSLLGALSKGEVLQTLHELEEPWRTSLAVLLPDLSLPSSPSPASLDPQATSRRLMEALYQLIRRVCGRGQVVLFLDDLQWVDKTTLCALEFLGERVPPPPISVVFALRDGSELDPSVRSFVDGVRQNGLWIQVDELDPASADLLLARAAPHPLSAAERQRLSEVSGRNPFFLIELANDYCGTEGDRVNDPGKHIPSSIRQLVSNRLDELPRESRTLLQLLSVVGSLRVDQPPVLEELPPAHLPDAADDLLRARLIQHEGTAITIRHDLIRQAAYELMGPIKRALLHRRAAEAVLQRMGETAHGEAAVHFDRAGERAGAFLHATRAALAAQGSGAVPEAIRFWDMARRNASTRQEAESTTRNLAELLYQARRLEDAIPLLEVSAAGAREEDAARYALMRLDALSELPGAAQERYLREVEAIAAQASTAGEWTRYLEAVEIRLRILDRLHREDDIRDQLLRMREVRDSGYITTPYASCLLHSILALDVLYHDDDEGMEAASTAVRLAEEHGIDGLLLRTYHRKLFCHILRGELDTREGKNTMVAVLARAEQSDDLKSKTTIYNNLGCYYLDTGDLRRAGHFLTAAAGLVSGASERALVYGNLGELHYLRGDYQAAEEYYRRALAETGQQPVSGFIEVAVMAGLGLCALATGRLSAGQQFENTIRRAMDSWIRDPYPLVRFLAELERRRGRLKEAVAVIRHKTVSNKRRPVFWIRIKLLEAKYLRYSDPAAADELMIKIEKEASCRGLSRMLTL